ncbi:hypothetical protein COLO4_38034 [Corchorus olitorius]|uniref:Uncharacterized protein n=1 Tax=Corchorus olitorius TaxID=93759 RepID=A0A1R3FXK2_9ROSI|nr:hypothetical protein COLO4_38034 [Corchorus olitorius]
MDSMNLINLDLDDDSSTKDCSPASSSNKRAKIMQELGDKVETVRISCTLPNRRESKLDSSNKRNASASSPTGTKKVDQQIFSDMSVRNCLRHTGESEEEENEV